MKGKVKLYSLVKGEGVILGEDSKEYRVKMAGIKGTGMKRLSEGQEVEFNLKESNKGTMAVDVEVI